ncbi:MAG TPA: nucleotidyltransferase family protein [Kofleriaceae bacterium]|nr:nucleotidyltransferase family protein [Kofleriaceae bacterium]
MSKDHQKTGEKAASSGTGPTEAGTPGIEHLPGALFRALLWAEPLPPPMLSAARQAAQGTAINWSAIVEALDTSGVGPLAITRMKEIGVADRIDPQAARRWEADRLHAELQCTLQRRDAVRITEHLTRLGIRHAFLKGFAVREWLYQPSWVRASSDSDLLIGPEDIERTRAALFDLGFVQASRTEDFRKFRPARPEEIAATEAEHFELAQFARVLRLANPPEWIFGPDYRRAAPSAFEQLPDGPILNSVVDVHWALHFHFADDRPLDTLTTVRAREGGLDIPTVSIEWHVLYTAFKLYFEAFDRPGWGLHMLADLAALLRAGRSLDWSWLEAQGAKKDLDAMLFYTLSAAERLVGQAIAPVDMMERLATGDVERPEGSKTELDLGDFMPYVLRRRLASSFLESSR